MPSRGMLLSVLLGGEGRRDGSVPGGGDAAPWLVLGSGAAGASPNPAGGPAPTLEPQGAEEKVL